MTVLVGLIHPADGVAIVADRASTATGPTIGHGMAAHAPPRVKVMSNGRGHVAGVSGIAENGGVSVLRLVDQVLSDASDTVDAIAGLMTSLRDAAEDLLGGIPVTGQPDELAVVVVVGGRDRLGTSLQVVALRWNGAVASASLDSSRAFAPPSVQSRADELLSVAARSGRSLSHQLDDWSSLMPQLAPVTITKDGVDVSPEHDYAITDHPGSSRTVAIEPPPVTLGVPRH